jgi:two-component system, response regulator PdtaR
VDRPTASSAQAPAPQSAGPRVTNLTCVVRSPDERLTGANDDAAPRILVVEDEYLVALQAESWLVEAGFDVVGIATSAQEAVALAEAKRPALVVMDVRLRGQVDGIDAALDIFQANGTRCIFATAHHDDRARSRAEPAQPLGWLPKPYAMECLVDMTRRALESLRKTD